MDKKDVLENKIKTMLNREVLEKIDNYAVHQIVKTILFAPSTQINWEEAYTFIMIFMPELMRYDGYKVENVFASGTA